MKKNHILFTTALMTLFLFSAVAQDKPPKAPSLPVTETFFNKQVNDPYRNLENLQDSNTKNFLLTNSAMGQTKISVEGVWRLTEWVEGGKTITDPQPGILIFTKGYYSVTILMAPRADSVIPPKDRRPLTDDEKIERFELWRPLSAFSGTYEVKGSMLVMRPIVAKNPWDMNKQTPQESELKPEGPTTIWLIPTGDNAIRVGLRMKLTRLE